ncbi:MAG: hypothetical protein IKJ33_00475 [Clostridia bacterium]|nr:hypothetical protein [Clostridia bacterium]
MSRFKKIFVILASLICASVLTFVITTTTMKSKVSIAIGSPYSVVVFDHSTSGVESKDENVFSSLNNEISNTTSITVFDKLINKITLDKKIYQDSTNKYAKWSTDILNKNLVVEVIYNSMQDLVVYEGKHSRVVSYYCLSFVIPTTTELTEIVVYYALTQNNDNNEKYKSYAECTPLILYGNAGELAEFLKNIKAD